MSRKYKLFPFGMEALFQVSSLVASIVVVMLFYGLVVAPTVNQYAANRAAQNVLPEPTPEGEPSKRPASIEKPVFFLIIKDYEQAICFILLFWALAIIGYKARASFKERRILMENLLDIPDGQRILPDDSVPYLHELQALPASSQDLLLTRVLRTSLSRFSHRADIQEISAAKNSLLEAETAKLDSQLSIIRYVAWAIPSVGFIGTVRGIGQALANADQAIEGNIGLVTDSLGVAFNSTFVALLISIVLMFGVHMLELLQEGLILDVDEYCDDNLIANMNRD